MAKISALLVFGLVLVLGQCVLSQDSSYGSEEDQLDGFLDFYSWPELIGETGEDAMEAILSEHPTFNVEIVNDKDPVTMDLRPDRVRVFVDDAGIVVNAPYNG